MISCNEYINWYYSKEKPNMLRSGLYGSEPTFLFMDRYGDRYYEFNRDNWNGGDILRRYLYSNWGEISVEGFDIKWYHVDDSWYVFLFTESSFYEISWYKSRGRTDRILKDGCLIDLEDYIELCNELSITLN